MRKYSELKDAALMALNGKWGGAVVLTLVFYIIEMIFSGLLDLAPSLLAIVPFIVWLAIAPVLEFNYDVVFLDNKRSGDKYELKQLFSNFDKQYSNIWLTIFLTYVYTLLWTLLFFILGVIKSYSYAMVPYILRDDSNKTGNAAIDLSREMMDGYKLDLFFLHLSFVGWFLLSILTFGLGLLWLVPYICATQAEFYEDVKAAYIEKHPTEMAEPLKDEEQILTTQEEPRPLAEE